MLTGCGMKAPSISESACEFQLPRDDVHEYTRGINNSAVTLSRTRRTRARVGDRSPGIIASIELPHIA